MGARIHDFSRCLFLPSSLAPCAFYLEGICLIMRQHFLRTS